MFYNRTIKILH